MRRIRTQCKGQCCRNPFNVCSHHRQCDYHRAEQIMHGLQDNPMSEESTKYREGKQ